MRPSLNFKTLSWLILIFITLACSDEGNAPQNFRLKESRTKDGSITIYEYTNDGKLAKVTSDGVYSSRYIYDSKGRLITANYDRPEYQYNRTEYSYRADNTLEESLSFSKEIGSNPEYKNKTTYLYSAGKVIETRYYYWNVTKGEWHTEPTIAKYTYDGKGNLTKFIRKTDYYVYSLDEFGNRTNIKSYELKPGSTTEFYLYRESSFNYDTKKNIYAVYNNPFIALSSSYVAANNILDAVHKDLDESGATIGSYNSTYTYEYNSAGYPTRQNDTEFTLEAF